MILYTYHTFTRYPMTCNYLIFYFQKKDSIGTDYSQMPARSKREVRYKLGIRESNDIKSRRGSNKIRAIQEAQGELSSEASIQQAGRSSSYINNYHQQHRFFVNLLQTKYIQTIYISLKDYQQFLRIKAENALMSNKLKFLVALKGGRNMYSSNI